MSFLKCDKVLTISQRHLCFTSLKYGAIQTLVQLLRAPTLRYFNQETKVENSQPCFELHLVHCLLYHTLFTYGIKKTFAMINNTL